MPVVIDEFEIISDPPAPETGRAPTPPARSPGSAAPDADELAAALLELHTRALRVWAH